MVFLAMRYMNEVYESSTFSKIADSCDFQEKKWIEKIKDKLTENLKIGKPLRYNWFREKKYENKRLFYLINESSKKAILVSFGNKKEQQKIIDR